MPRSELNNPTERISRLLAEIEELLGYISEYEDYVRPHLPTEILVTCPNRPVPIEYEKEKVRRSLSHHKKNPSHRTVEQILANRLSQRRSRLRRDEGYNVRGRDSYRSVSEAEIAAAIEKEVEAETVSYTTTTEVVETTSSGDLEDAFAAGFTPHKQGSALTIDDIARLKREIEEQ